LSTQDKSQVNPDQLAAIEDLGGKFMQYQPNWTGPSTPAMAVTSLLGVTEKASIENGYAGSFVPHHGNKQWL
jgi:hypothetical protein